MKKRLSIKPKRMNEIRFHQDYVTFKKKKIRHPKYIWRKRGNIYDYHSITHSKEINGKHLIKLRKNPSPKDKKEAYYNPESESDVKSTFGKKLKNWKLDPLDVKDIHKK